MIIVKILYKVYVLCNTHSGDTHTHACTHQLQEQQEHFGTSVQAITQLYIEEIISTVEAQPVQTSN